MGLIPTFFYLIYEAQKSCVKLSRYINSASESYNMDEFSTWFENLFFPKPNSDKIFTGSETHVIIVINDDTNSMEYIVEKFVSIFDIPQRQAVELMMRIHTEGIAVVWAGNSNQAEQYLLNLRDARIKSLIKSVL